MVLIWNANRRIRTGSVPVDAKCFFQHEPIVVLVVHHARIAH